MRALFLRWHKKLPEDASISPQAWVLVLMLTNTPDL